MKRTQQTGVMRPIHGMCKLCIATCITLGTSVESLHAEPGRTVTPDEVIRSLESGHGVHAGQRRNHIKGTCATGFFAAQPSEASSLSRSMLFSGRRIPVIARFSLAGSNPDAPDTMHSARGLALEFRLPDGSVQHMTMLNTPVFGAADPGGFNDMVLATKPDPATGKPNPKVLKAFFDRHPEAMAQAHFLQTNAPPASYAEATFYSVHTFKFVDEKKAEHLVRWRFVPQDVNHGKADTRPANVPHDFLEKSLIERTKLGPVHWDMLVYVGQAGDPVDNPTLPWPEDRHRFKAGTLTLSQAMPQHGAACEGINFDPLVMAPGIAPTNDPVLLFRSPAYALSFAKRLAGQ